MSRFGRATPMPRRRPATIPLVNRPLVSTSTWKYGVGGVLTSTRVMPYTITTQVASTRVWKWGIVAVITSTRAWVYFVQGKVENQRVWKWNVQQGVTFTVSDSFLASLGKLSLAYGTPLKSFAMGTGGYTVFTSSDIALTEALRLLARDQPSILREGL